MKMGGQGMALLKHFEGCKLEAYQDVVGVWTIGYGSTMEVHKGQRITQEEADHLLLHDLERFEQGVGNLTHHAEMKQRQFDALISFSFNLGLGNLEKSTLLKMVNRNEYEAASEEFLKWNKAGGVVREGLTRRRKAERALFRGEDWRQFIV